MSNSAARTKNSFYIQAFARDCSGKGCGTLPARVLLRYPFCIDVHATISVGHSLLNGANHHGLLLHV